MLGVSHDPEGARRQWRCGVSHDRRSTPNVDNRRFARPAGGKTDTRPVPWGRRAHLGQESSVSELVGSDQDRIRDELIAVHESPEFIELRRKHRRLVFPLAALFLGWYFLYVLLADYAHDFMSHKLAGNITVGLIMGLLQFVSTFAITTFYVRYANNHLDPAATQIREEIEGAAR
jgi:uncharacterized membrane protein (DUF485 family)